MLGLSWGEMLVVGILALIVLGPKDLLTSFRTVGQWVGRMQKLARDFSRAMNEAADEAGVGEINRSLKAASNPAKFGTDSLKKAAGMGPETSKLAEKRAADAKEVVDKARAARERRAEAAAAAAAEMEDDLAEAEAMDALEAEPPASAAPTKTGVRKPAAKKATTGSKAKNPPAKKPAARKPAAKKPAAKKPSASKTVAEKPAAKKPSARKRPAAKAKNPGQTPAPNDQSETDSK